MQKKTTLPVIIQGLSVSVEFIKGPYRTQVGLTNSFTLIVTTMRLATLALLSILSATVYAAPRKKQTQGIGRAIAEECDAVGSDCNYNHPNCCPHLVCRLGGDSSGVRYQVPVHLFCFSLTGILVTSMPRITHITSYRNLSGQLPGFRVKRKRKAVTRY